MEPVPPSIAESEKSAEALAASLRVGEIMHAGVTSVDASATVAEAARVMERNDLRNVIFQDRGSYRIFTVGDLIEHLELIGDTGMPLSRMPFHPLACVSERTPVSELIDHFDEDRNRYLGVLGAQGGLVGVVSFSDVVSALGPAEFLDVCRVAELFEGPRHLEVAPQAAFRTVLHALRSVEGAAIVVEQGRPLGILTSRHAIRLVTDGASLDAPVERYMQAPVDALPSGVRLADALDYLKRTGYKRIVVVDEDGRLLGTVTQSELARYGFHHWTHHLRRRLSGLDSDRREARVLARRLEREAMTDPLTGIGNRRMFNRLLEKEWHRCQRHGSALSLVLFDVDHFKRINDRWGHPKGDAVLRSLAALIERQLRGCDTVCRWGGEEFAVLLPETDADGAWKLAERLRRAAEDAELAGLRVTISLGAAQCAPGERIPEWIARADRALYAAKQAGRNRAVCDAAGAVS